MGRKKKSVPTPKRRLPSSVVNNIRRNVYGQAYYQTLEPLTHDYGIRPRIFKLDSRGKPVTEIVTHTYGRSYASKKSQRLVEGGTHYVVKPSWSGFLKGADMSLSILKIFLLLTLVINLMMILNNPYYEYIGFRQILYILQNAPSPRIPPISKGTVNIPLSFGIMVDVSTLLNPLITLINMISITISWVYYFLVTLLFVTSA